MDISAKVESVIIQFKAKYSDFKHEHVILELAQEVISNSGKIIFQEGRNSNFRWKAFLGKEIPVITLGTDLDSFDQVIWSLMHEMGHMYQARTFNSLYSKEVEMNREREAWKSIYKYKERFPEAFVNSEELNAFIDECLKSHKAKWSSEIDTSSNRSVSRM